MKFRITQEENVLTLSLVGDEIEDRLVATLSLIEDMWKVVTGPRYGNRTKRAVLFRDMGCLLTVLISEEDYREFAEIPTEPQFFAGRKVVDYAAMWRHQKKLERILASALNRHVFKVAQEFSSTEEMALRKRYYSCKGKNYDGAGTIVEAVSKAGPHQFVDFMRYKPLVVSVGLWPLSDWRQRLCSSRPTRAQNRWIDQWPGGLGTEVKALKSPYLSGAPTRLKAILVGLHPNVESWVQMVLRSTDAQIRSAQKQWCRYSHAEYRWRIQDILAFGRIMADHFHLAGRKPTIVAVFEAARATLVAELEESEARLQRQIEQADTSPLPVWDGDVPPFQVQLSTEMDFVIEKQRMNHCILNYVGSARCGEGFFFHAEYPDLDDGGATVEVGPAGRVRQSYGPRDVTNKSSKRASRAWRKVVAPMGGESATPR